MDKVSIITPVYKVERYIQECVESVLSQSYQDIEFILVDDCGGDRSIEIAEQILKENKHIGFTYQILHHDHNKGVSAARNTAIKAANGKFLFFLDGDDKLTALCIEHLVKRIKETDVDIVICGHLPDGYNKDLGGHLCAPVDMVNNNGECIHAFAANWFNVAPWCKLLKRSFVECNGLYFKEGIINEDAPWTFQLCLCANRIAFLNEDLYYYRYNDNSIMSASKVLNIIESNEIALKIFFDEISSRKHLYGNVDIYTIFIRQVVILFTIISRCGFKIYSKKIRIMKTINMNSIKLIYRGSPISYKLWNIMFLLPSSMAAIISFIFIKLQNRKLLKSRI